MANDENLIPLNQRSKSVQREIQEKGRQANKAKWAEKRLLKDAILERMGADDWNELVDGLIDRAKGNDKAFEVLRDTIGQKPIDKVAVTNIDQSLGELNEYFGRQESPDDTPATE